MPPKFSIILPVLNGENYLREAIESILAQTYPDWELLIGDDGSKDATPEIMKSFPDPRIRLFFRKSDFGLFKNCNYLLKEARGELCHFMSHDDIMEPTCLAEELAFFRAYPQVGLSYCASSAIDARGNPLPHGSIGRLPEYLLPELSQQHFFYHGNIIGSQSLACVRTKALREAGGFDETYRIAGDYEMWARLSRHYPLGILKQSLLKIRLHPSQMSHGAAWAVSNIVEKRAVRRATKQHLPAEIRRHAQIYEWLHYSGWEVTACLYWVKRGKLRLGLQIIRGLGIGSFVRAAAIYAVTLGNRLGRWEAKFVRVPPLVDRGGETFLAEAPRAGEHAS